jgi:peptidyl-prolyl cis-trans isomerase A (cyclophilin A)
VYHARLRSSLKTLERGRLPGSNQMKTTHHLRVTGLAMLLTLAALMPRSADATVVEFQTVMGNFEVNLYDNATPATVANFLEYVNNGDYSNAIFHRSVPGFIVQGGGFRFDLAWPVSNIPARPAVVNEPEFSNLRGTIAMAKLGNDPNSATSQWFFNLIDNSAALDPQNGGFTVFGEVVGTGMSVIDQMAAVPRFGLGGAFNEIPLRNYAGGDPDATNLVTISAIIITDSTVDSAGVAGLNPAPNTLINAPPPVVPPPVSSGGGGGSLGFFAILGLLILNQVKRGLRWTRQK